MRKKLMMGGTPVADMSLKELKGEAAMLKYFLAIEYDQGPTIAQNLIEAGVLLPDPESLNDVQVSEKVWEVINGLAKLNHYISMTDHLSDRELYQFFWSGFLDQTTSEMGEGLGIVAREHQIVDSDSREYYKYYSNEFDIEFFDSIYPDEEPPTRVEPPYDRDSKLPKLMKV